MILVLIIACCAVFAGVIGCLALGIRNTASDADDFDGGWQDDASEGFRPSPQAVAECGCDGARLDATGHCVGCAWLRTVTHHQV